MAGVNPTLVETPDTRSLLKLAQAGDTEAFGQLYRLYATRLLRQAVSLCGNEAMAEELAQDTLVEAWKCLGHYDARCQFFTWLCAILLNRHRNMIRKSRFLLFSSFRTGTRDGSLQMLEKVADRSCSPDENAELADQSALVRKCIQALPCKHQEVIYLRFYVDDSLDGIAAALGCSVGTVKSRLFHALEKLRRMNALNEQFANLKGMS